MLEFEHTKDWHESTATSSSNRGQVPSLDLASYYHHYALIFDVDCDIPFTQLIPPTSPQAATTFSRLNGHREGHPQAAIETAISAATTDSRSI